MNTSNSYYLSIESSDWDATPNGIVHIWHNGWSRATDIKNVSKEIRSVLWFVCLAHSSDSPAFRIQGSLSGRLGTLVAKAVEEATISSDDYTSVRSSFYGWLLGLTFGGKLPDVVEWHDCLMVDDGYRLHKPIQVLIGSES